MWRGKSFAIERRRGSAGSLASRDGKISQPAAVTKNDSQDAGQRGKGNVVERQNPGKCHKLENCGENEYGDAVPAGARYRNPCRSETEEWDHAVLPNAAEIARRTGQFHHPVFERQLKPREPSRRVRNTCHCPNRRLDA